MTDHLRRSLAPISDAAWAAIEEEASRTLRHFLAARPLVEFSGPHGWDHSAVNLGRIERLSSAPEGIELARRRVLPLMELRTTFELSIDELDAADRGALDIDLEEVTKAATRAALAEDRAIFQGVPEAGIPGIVPASPHSRIPISDDYNEYPSHVAKAVALLRGAGVGGPYAIALGPRCHTGVIETTQHGGYPVLEHIRLILGGPVIWAPAVDGAVVISQRGGDFRITSGQDFSIGYLSHDANRVTLFLEESFTFEVIDPRAAVALVYQD